MGQPDNVLFIKARDNDGEQEPLSPRGFAGQRLAGRDHTEALDRLHPVTKPIRRPVHPPRGGFRTTYIPSVASPFGPDIRTPLNVAKDG
jgi:hypothetical protein